MANYVCHRNDRPILCGGTMILFRCGIDHNYDPVSYLQQMEATPISVIIGRRPIKPRGGLSVTRPIFG